MTFPQGPPEMWAVIGLVLTLPALLSIAAGRWPRVGSLMGVYEDGMPGYTPRAAIVGGVLLLALAGALVVFGLLGLALGF